MSKDFFVKRPSVQPTIYVYKLDELHLIRLYKVGYTERDIERRVAEQLQTSGIPYRILLRSAMF